MEKGQVQFRRLGMRMASSVGNVQETENPLEMRLFYRAARCTSIHNPQSQNKTKQRMAKLMGMLYGVRTTGFP
jgi:hypothetical protein